MVGTSLGNYFLNMYFYVFEILFSYNVQLYGETKVLKLQFHEIKTIFVLRCKIHSDSPFMALEKQINFNLQILRLFLKFHIIGSQALLE